MTAFPDLSRLAPGTRVQDPFLVLDVETRSGDHPHTVLILANRSGTIPTTPFWEEDLPRIEGIRRRTIVHIAGEIDTYREHRQLRVRSIRAIPPGVVDLAQLLPSVENPQPHWDYLDRLRSELKAPRLRAIVDLFYADAEFRASYAECPGSVAGHHAELGGLLKHTAEVAAIALAIAEAAGADRDLVVAGSLLHDIGKLAAYRWGGLFDGKQEFGAAVPPLTLEAEVLHFADNASAKTASMAAALEKAANFTGDALVSSPARMVDRRRVYRGKSDWGAW